MTTDFDPGGTTLTSLSGSLLRRAAVGVALAAAFVLAGNAAAFADGGQTIATATPVALGALEVGNTTTGGLTTDGAGGYNSYWALNVTNGDNVSIGWQAPLDSDGNGPQLSAFDVRIDDSSVAHANPLTWAILPPAGQSTMTFTAVATGVLPLQFQSGECCDEADPGPYSFMATVTHAVALTLPTVSSMPASGTMDVSVANPDGVGLSDPSLAIDLQVRSAGQGWSTIGTASASGGVAGITYSVPSGLNGQTVKIQAVAHGAGYQTQTSESQSVTISAAGTTTPGSGTASGRACVVPRVVGRTLARARHALRGAGCRPGHVSRAPANGGRHGRVRWQSRVAGTRVSRGSTVNLVVDR
jgi:hypothetical protein